VRIGKQKQLFFTLYFLVAIACGVLGCARSAKTEGDVVMAPDFTLPSLDGGTRSLADFRGRPLILVFWRINCPSCEYQMPFLQAFYEKWSDDEVALVTVNVGEPPAMVGEYVARHGLTFPVLLDTRQQVAQTYGIIGVPFTFLIDAEGIVRAYKVGPFQGSEAIEGAVKKVFPDVELKM
jgi:peroxiredoxin